MALPVDTFEVKLKFAPTLRKVPDANTFLRHGDKVCWPIRKCPFCEISSLFFIFLCALLVTVLAGNDLFSSLLASRLPSLSNPKRTIFNNWESFGFPLPDYHKESFATQLPHPLALHHPQHFHPHFPHNVRLQVPHLQFNPHCEPQPFPLAFKVKHPLHYPQRVSLRNWLQDSQWLFKCHEVAQSERFCNAHEKCVSVLQRLSHLLSVSISLKLCLCHPQRVSLRHWLQNS